MKRLTESGFEIPDNRSLVAVVDLTPVTMGERVQRYMRTPSLRDELVFSDEDYDPDDFHDDDDRPMSPHEERFAERQDRIKAHKARLDLERQEQALEEQREADAAFAARVKSVKDAIPRSE